MPKQRYEEIYNNLKLRIEEGNYPFQTFLPSENQLREEFDCSRNTVRRALSMLIDNGYVTALHGKGVRCIYQSHEQAQFLSSEIETFREAAVRNGLSYETKVILFTDLKVDSKIARYSGFALGEEIYYIQRVHYIGGQPLILNHNYFLKGVVSGLTPEIAAHSIYDYLENTLHMSITSAKREITVEPITELDEKYLDLNPKEFNCLAIMKNRTFNSDGIMFEYTVSRHRPDHFSFTTTASRRTGIK